MCSRARAQPVLDQRSDRALSVVGPQRRGRGSRGLVLEPPVSQAKMMDTAPTPREPHGGGRQGRGGMIRGVL